MIQDLKIHEPNFGL